MNIDFHLRRMAVASATNDKNSIDPILSCRRCNTTRKSRLVQADLYKQDQRGGTGWPDWANFRLVGDCFLLGHLLKITEVA
jgi:hypothetical protein